MQGHAGYLRLKRSELETRVESALSELACCKLCPWLCEVDRRHDPTTRANRYKGKRPVCKTWRKALVSSCFAHHGEEACLRGTRGSGTLFFSWCNLRCVFCQNYDVSQSPAGEEVGAEQLADMMLQLQAQGCHNLNFVTPEHVVPQILEGLLIAIHKGLNIPIVYNTSAYDSLRSLELLDGIVDIYMPDFKVWDREVAQRYLKTPQYPEVARAVIKEMHRQVGPLQIDAKTGLASHGLIVRHLVLPNGEAGTDSIMKFLVDEVSPRTYVNIMGQYTPQYKARNYPHISRSVNREEVRAACMSAIAAGLTRIDWQAW